MSFYTALTGLNGSQSDISATSNNIANVNTTGFKRSRAELLAIALSLTSCAPIALFVILYIFLTSIILP